MDLQQNIKQRAGRFKVSRQGMQAFPELIMQVMGRMLIMRCEHMALEDEYEYSALSMLFDEIKIGEKIPMYEIYFNTIGRPGIFAERVEGRTIH